MSIANKEVCGRFHELFRTGNIELARAVLAEDFVWRTPVRAQLSEATGAGADRNGIVEFAARLRAAFPDLQFTVTNTLAQGDRVVAAWSFAGTHRGAWAGAAASGRPVRVAGINTLRICNGQVFEMWHHWDEMELLQQVDAMPPLPWGVRL